MIETTAAGGSLSAARALGRCYGAMFFAVFGCLWLMIGAFMLQHVQVLMGFIPAGAAALVMLAMALAGRARAPAEGAIPEAEKKRQGRIFGIINAAEGIAIFLVAQFLPRLGHIDLVMPAIAVIVGLHFFPLPPLYRWRANLITGALLIMVGILSPMLFQGRLMVEVTSLASGSILWGSSAWALKTASDLMRGTIIKSSAVSL